jgi:hypothetical protein
MLMKAVWAVGLGLLVAAPIMALPTRWSPDRDRAPARHAMGEAGIRDSHVAIVCPRGGSGDVDVAIGRGDRPEAPCAADRPV